MEVLEGKLKVQQLTRLDVYSSNSEHNIHD